MTTILRQLFSLSLYGLLCMVCSVWFALFGFVVFGFILFGLALFSLKFFGSEWQSHIFHTYLTSIIALET